MKSQIFYKHTKKAPDKNPVLFMGVYSDFNL